MVFDMLKLLILGVLCCYGRGDVFSIKFPRDNPCLLVDIDADFKLTWTDMNGKEQTRPDFTLNGTAIDSGTCAKNTESPAVSLSWSDGGTFMFTFTNKSDIISYGWNMRYSPESVFNNNSQTATVLHSGNLGTGPSKTAFACQHVPVVNNTQNQTGMNKYQLIITIKSIKAQAFNVKDGKFSEDDKCPADIQSTSASPSSPSSPRSSKPTNATIKTSPASTKPTNATIKTSPASTKPTNATTKPTTATTKPTNVTTKPTTATTKPTNVTTKPTTVPTPVTTPVPAPNAHAKQTFEVYAEDKQCVLMQGEFLFTLMYPKNDNTIGSVNIGLQEIRKVSGDCLANANSENIVTVEFYDRWMFMITLSKKSFSGLHVVNSDGSTQYFWSRIYLRYSYATTLGGMPLFPNVRNQSLFTVPELNVSLADGTYGASTGGSYMCISNQNIDLMGGNKLQTWNLHYDAFRTANHTIFYDKNIQECSKDSKVNNTIAIAACGALVAMALVVLFSYLTRRIKLHIRLEFKSDDEKLITRPYRST